MDSFEVYKRYLNAKKRFNDELNAIQKAYISSNYNFKEGDIVKIKGERLEPFTEYLLIEDISFRKIGRYPTDNEYKEFRIEISGKLVDEEGYDCQCFFSHEEYLLDMIEIEVTNIRYKGLRKR